MDVIAVSQMIALENPTCTARLMYFEVVAVAMQPPFHHMMKLVSVKTWTSV